MPRITVTLSDAAHEWVGDRADERGCPLSEIVRELVDDARGEGESLERRLSALETRVERLEGGDAGPHRPDDSEPVPIASLPGATPHHSDAIERLGDRIRTQLPKGTSDAEADAVVAVVEYIRDEGWATPQEIRDAVHDDHPAGSHNPEWWWRDKIAGLLEAVDCVERVHQRRVEWVGEE